jgi:hypothetical protein
MRPNNSGLGAELLRSPSNLLLQNSTSLFTYFVYYVTIKSYTYFIRSLNAAILFVTSPAVTN